MINMNEKQIMNTQQLSKVINANALFDDCLMDPKSLYLHCFDALPNVSFIGNIDGEKAYRAFVEQFRDAIERIYQYNWYNSKEKAFRFSTTLAVMKNNCIVEFDVACCEILHDGTADLFIDEVVKKVSHFKERNKRRPLEINLVVTKNNKGIVLLHGIPGSGKTTYLRYLIGKIRKRVLFLSPGVAGNLTSPDFIGLLMNNPNTVLVIEDAENVIMDRRQHTGSSVSNLLNVSDGLLSDCLNIQLICTFNSTLSLVDSALMRKGRLIARYEFGKLSITKARRLSRHLGFDTDIDRPMTIAEIANPNEKDHAASRIEVIGFKSSSLMKA